MAPPWSCWTLLGGEPAIAQNSRSIFPITREVRQREDLLVEGFVADALDHRPVHALDGPIRKPPLAQQHLVTPAHPPGSDHAHIITRVEARKYPLLQPRHA